MQETYKNRIVDEMQLRGLSPDTIECYSSCLKLFMNQFKGRRPSQLNLQDIKNYHRKLRLRGQSNRYINMQMSSIRFFFRNNVKNYKIDLNQIPYLPETRKLPFVLGREEVKQIINSCTNVKHRAMMIFLYATGVRINELINVKISDIDGREGTIFISTGKGAKQRHVTLSPKLREELRSYYQQVKHNSVWLFPGNDGNRISRADYVSVIFRAAKNKCGIKCPGSGHLMRHGFASHSLENGVDLRTLQMLLGHESIETTCIYLHVSKKHISQVKSPLDGLL
jgi:site-specific recombinase XerD